MATTHDTLQTEKRLTKAQLDADVTYLTNVIGRVHPNMYHSISKQRYRKLTDSVRSQLHEGMTVKEAWPLLAKLVGALHEGHSVFDFPYGVFDLLKGGGRILFPVSLSGFDGTSLIVRMDRSNEDVLKPGDAITAINGISASQLINKLSGYAGGLKAFRALDVCRNISVCLYLYEVKAPYQINYTRNGQTGIATLNALSWPEIFANSKSRSMDSTKPTELTDYTFEYLDGNTAYLAVNSLTEKPEVFQHYLDSCFTLLKKKPASKLIIDFRRNSGGNSMLGEILLTYITEKPFRMSGGEKWKVSEEYKQQIRKNNGADTGKMANYMNAKNGSILSDDGGKPKRPQANALAYKGKVYVLIGSNTFSSANMTVNAIQDYDLATLVGEPTGEPANDYGELIFLKLPYTAFTFSTSTKQFVRSNGNAKDSQPVLPRYKVVDDVITSKDEAISFIESL